MSKRQRECGRWSSNVKSVYVSCERCKCLAANYEYIVTDVKCTEAIWVCMKSTYIHKNRGTGRSKQCLAYVWTQIKTKLMYQRIHVRDLSWYRFDMSCLYLIPSLSMMVFSNEWLNGRYMEQTYDLWNLWVYMSVRWEVMNNNLRLYIQLLFVGIDEHRSIKGSWKRVVCLHPPDSMQMMCDCREGPLCMHVRDIFKRK